MPKQPSDLRTSKKLRAGIDHAGWTGLNKDWAPGAIKDTQLTQAINVRIDGGIPKERGGQTKLNHTPVGEDPAVFSCDGFFDASDIGVRTTSVRPPGPMPRPSALYMGGVGTGPVAALFNGAALASDMFNATMPTSLAAPVLIASGSAVGNSTVTGDPVPLQHLTAHGGAIWASTQAVNTQQRVDTWAGTGAITVSEAVNPTGAYPRYLHSFGGDLYAVCSIITGTARRLSAGVWGNLTTPANALLTGFVTYGGALYTFGAGPTAGVGKPRIYSVSTTAVTLAHEFPCTGVTGGYVQAAVALNGILYVAYVANKVSATQIGVNRIASFDGVAWTDTVKDLSVQFGDTDSQGAVSGLATDGTRLITVTVAFNASGGFSNGQCKYFYESPADPTGTWVAASASDLGTADNIGGQPTQTVPSYIYSGTPDVVFFISTGVQASCTRKLVRYQYVSGSGVWSVGTITAPESGSIAPGAAFGGPFGFLDSF